jgi:hypothetical protein
MYSTQSAVFRLAAQYEAANDYLQKQDDHDGREVECTHRGNNSTRTTHEGFSCTKEPLVDGGYHSTWLQWEPRQDNAEKNDEHVKVQQLT